MTPSSGKGGLVLEQGPRVQAALRHVLPKPLREPVQCGAHTVRIPPDGGDRLTPVAHADAVDPPARKVRLVRQGAGARQLIHREEHAIHKQAA